MGDDSVTAIPRPFPSMKPRILPIAAMFLAVMAVPACTTTEVSSTRDLLSAAGFYEVTPKGARQEELYAAAPAYKMHQITAEGKTLYMYKDEKRGTAFVGDGVKFRQYQRLLLQESAAEQETVVMAPSVAMGWYGAYNPYFHTARYYAPRVGYGTRYYGPRAGYGAVGRVGRYR